MPLSLVVFSFLGENIIECLVELSVVDMKGVSEFFLPLVIKDLGLLSSSYKICLKFNTTLVFFFFPDESDFLSTLDGLISPFDCEGEPD